MFNISPEWLLHGKGEMVADRGEEEKGIPYEYKGYVDKLIMVFDKGPKEKVGRLKERIDLYYEEIQDKEAQKIRVEKKGA